MLPVRAWRIYLEHSEFDSTQGTWDDAPDDGVQVIVYYHDGRRTLQTGVDDYPNLSGKGKTKAGSLIADGDYEARLERAHTEDAP